MDKHQAWKEWEEQERLIADSARKQGEIIKAYIETNKTKLKLVKVREYYKAKTDGSDKPVEMIQLPSTYNTYYYHEGNFYKERSLTDVSSSVFNDSGCPFVGDMIRSNDLLSLFMNVNFVKSLLGMDTIGGSCPPGAM